ncbi:YceD family protein [Candidatus Nitrosacidococcus sp. I8]|uniref:YceD family protein n=1 Tax=Candidatus Nitrosacidococcus sp. I8 TaxID=2942908 RepID=UPI002226FFFE|nr:YceD family protein [Candidatus Nitrosacidococcus sp. I8]CAH9018453.1 Large ribosomal RNA subunit accumulation protein YceD [Candidatus Nitrosacidococcus sp. I8]
MLAYLPNEVLPWQLVKSGTTLEGEILFANMPRVIEEVLNKTGSVWANLKFGYDNKGIPIIQGNIKANIYFTCQRCLQPMNTGISSKIALCLVYKDTDIDQYNKLPYEFIVLSTLDNLSLWDLIEDELLLSFPIAPKHVQESNCLSGESPSISNLNNKQNSFSVLNKLK